jgi:hypothetical protein
VVEEVRGPALDGSIWLLPLVTLKVTGALARMLPFESVSETTRGWVRKPPSGPVWPLPLRLVRVGGWPL